MRAIGGFLELERELEPSEMPLPPGIRLAYGRVAFRLILEALRPSRAFLPFFTCDALLEPLRLLDIPFDFYSIDISLEPSCPVKIGERDIIVYINYFGLRQQAITKMAAQYGSRLVLDNTQAFYAPDFGVCSFNSARKFFGVPDGSFLRGPVSFPVSSQVLPRGDVTTDYLFLRSDGKLDAAYKAFTEAERRISCNLRGMSEFSERILSRVNLQEVAERRRSNFGFYHSALGASNRLPVELASDAVPLCYPYLPPVSIDRHRLHTAGLFVPLFWPGVAERDFSGYAFERMISCDLLPLPLDQRYGMNELQRAIEILRTAC
jgi:hypothetical protein